MSTKFLLDSETADIDGPPFAFDLRGVRGMSGIAQASLGGGTATVKLFGRVSAKFAWKEIQLWMSDDAIEVVLFPEMKGEITGYSSGTISLAIVGGL